MSEELFFKIGERVTLDHTEFPKRAMMVGKVVHALPGYVLIGVEFSDTTPGTFENYHYTHLRRVTEPAANRAAKAKVMSEQTCEARFPGCGGSVFEIGDDGFGAWAADIRGAAICGPCLHNPHDVIADRIRANRVAKGEPEDDHTFRNRALNAERAGRNRTNVVVCMASACGSGLDFYAEMAGCKRRSAAKPSSTGVNGVLEQLAEMHHVMGVDYAVPGSDRTVITITSAGQAKELCGEGSRVDAAMKYFIAMGRDPESPGKYIERVPLTLVPIDPSLEDFTAAIEKHLVPMLPARLRCVTDRVSAGKSFHSDMFVLWVLDQDGAKIERAAYADVPDQAELESVARSVAVELMAREAKTPT